MSNHLIQQGRMWYAKVAIPADVQSVFGKRAFKKSLRTSNKIDAIARSGPIIAGFKDAIAEARGKPLRRNWRLLALMRSKRSK